MATFWLRSIWGFKVPPWPRSSAKLSVKYAGSPKNVLWSPKKVKSYKQTNCSALVIVNIQVALYLCRRSVANRQKWHWQLVKELIAWTSSSQRNRMVRSHTMPMNGFRFVHAARLRTKETTTSSHSSPRPKHHNAP